METPEELYERARDNLRTPPWLEWDAFPVEGELRVKALQPPTEVDRPRFGEGGIDCRSCAAPDDRFFWTNDRWRLQAIGDEIGLPFAGMLSPREHYEDPGDLPEHLAADLGIMLGKIDRAVRSIGEIGRVHFNRWGDGGAHLHWWCIARPARMPQIVGSFVALWDDILPPLPEDMRLGNIAAVKAALHAGI